MIAVKNGVIELASTEILSENIKVVDAVKTFFNND